MLIVFDLDFTLWDAGGTWCDHTIPPYRKEGSVVRDGVDRVIYLYPDVPEILKVIQDAGLTMAVASRTHSPETARRLMELMGISSFFSFEEIYPGSKLQHFESLHRITSVPYNRMFFFDDEERNVYETRQLGVNSFHVLSGLSWHEVRCIPEISD